MFALKSCNKENQLGNLWSFPHLHHGILCVDFSRIAYDLSQVVNCDKNCRYIQAIASSDKPFNPVVIIIIIFLIFDNYLDHRLDTKKNLNFPIYL